MDNDGGGLMRRQIGAKFPHLLKVPSSAPHGDPKEKQKCVLLEFLCLNSAAPAVILKWIELLQTRENLALKFNQILKLSLPAAKV